ncbi:MAG: TIGR04255 family protein [Bacteroidetes bacterium]|nr:MAG: TIGR04255 family protein [Bacteroidota bacterium]
MEFKNHKISEAVCAMRFSLIPDWDITYFAKFYDLINLIGYSVKQEIKPIQLSFDLNLNQSIEAPKLVEKDIQMVFKTADGKYAIIYSNGYVSIHTLGFYPGWDFFLKETANVLEKYLSIHHNSFIISTQMIYINTFTLSNDENLSDYFNFMPKTENFGQGSEISQQYHTTYSIIPNKKLQIRTFLTSQDNLTRNIFLECSCLTENVEKIESSEWSKLANEAHDGARNLFVKIVTEKFKEKIK